MVIHSLIVYFNYDVSTTSRTIFETPTLFPKVTFCNINWITTKYAYNLTQNGVKWSDMQKGQDKQKKLGHDLDDILLDCTFNNNQCNSIDFHWSYDETYGNCYTFNSGLNSNRSEQIKLKETSIGGPDLGLKLTLYVNIYEELLNDTDNIGGLGALIRIGNSSYSSDYLNGGIFIPPGFQLIVNLNQCYLNLIVTVK